MCVLTNVGEFGGDLPTLECSECDTRFSIVWNRNLVYDQPQYCPFCGDYVNDIEWECDDA
jgi:NAD-dependent SIR2 family protein deacetylase